MRERVDAGRIREFMRRLGAVARQDTRIYLTGGATAVLLGWRKSTADVDIKIVPESDEVFRAIPELKELLHVNVELASPDMFVPPMPGWEGRSRFECTEGRAHFYHFDPYTQVLSKVERDLPRDRTDVKHMLELGLVEVKRFREMFEELKPAFSRYPAIDLKSLARRVENMTGKPAN